MEKLKQVLLALAVVCAGSSVAIADEIKAGDLVVAQAWSRATPKGVKAGSGCNFVDLAQCNRFGILVDSASKRTAWHFPPARDVRWSKGMVIPLCLMSLLPPIFGLSVIAFPAIGWILKRPLRWRPA